jgi:hypothetical protein
MKSTRERAEELRQQKLDALREQVEAGTLTVRKMTTAERAANPPRPRTESGHGRRRRG